MFISGEALFHSFKLPFSIHGVRGGVWKVTVSGPGQLKLEGETRDESAFGLLDSMLHSGYKQCCRDFPGQAPPEPPLPRPALRVPVTEPAAPKRKAFNRRIGR